MHSNNNLEDVIIVVGAGPAGLTAAYELARNGDYKVVVIEALDRVGGLSRTVQTPYGRMDLGGHRFFTKEGRVNDFWHNVAGDMMVERERHSRILYRGHLLDYPVRLSGDTFRAMGIGGTIRAGWGYMCSTIHKRPERSLEDFYINRFGRGLYSMFFESYTAKVWGVHPSALSPDWGAQRVKSLSVSKVIKDMFRRRLSGADVPTTLIRRFEYPPHGPGQLWEAVADRLEKLGGRVILNTRVDAIVVNNNNSVTSVKLSDGTTIQGRTVVNTMPLKKLAESLQGAKLSPEAKKIASELQYRDFIMVGLPVCRESVKMPLTDNWIYVQDKRVNLGRLQVFNNWSRDMVSDPDNVIWLGLEYFVSKGDQLWTMSDEYMARHAIKELITIGLIDNATDVLVDGITRINVPDAYPSYLGAYYQLDRLKEELDAIGGLWTIGRAGLHRYNNMDHSMLTGMLAADAILNGSIDRTPVWSVNTSDDYHEEGK